MTEILTESFCERCGTRYTFESAAPASRRLGGLKVLGRGLKQFVMSDSTSLDEAIASARSEVERDATNQQLDAFHRTFSFCLGCRQYTCANCWNEAEARCQSCAPLAVAQDDPYGSDEASFGEAAGLIGVEPVVDHAHEPPVHVPPTFTDAWAAPPPIEFQASPPIADPSVRDATAEAAATPEPLAMDGIWIGAPDVVAWPDIQGEAVPPVTPAGALDHVVPSAQAGDDDGEADTARVEAREHAPVGDYFTDGSAPRGDAPEWGVGGADGGEAATTDDSGETTGANERWPAAVSEPTSPVTRTPQVDSIAQPVWPDPTLARPAVSMPEPVPPTTMPEAAAAEAASSPPEHLAPARPAFPPIATPAVPPVVPPVLPPEPVVPAASAAWPASDAAAPSPAPSAPIPPVNHDRPAAAPQWPTGPRWPTGNRPADAASPAVDPLAALIARKTTDAMWAASNRQILQPIVASASAAAVKACGSCGTSLSANARFCRRCGTPQA